MVEHLKDAYLPEQENIHFGDVHLSEDSSSHKEIFNKPILGASKEIFKFVLNEVRQEMADDLNFAEQDPSDELEQKTLNNDDMSDV